MKNWLELIPIYARVHKRGSRMTRTCIALAVFLMAALFGMADRYLQGERVWQIRTYGSWQFTGDGDASQIYAVAMFLALLVMAAAVLMISGSLNGNVLQRTEFFGMLRCLGATRGQILRYVRLEALCWCRTAVPAGLLAAAAAVCLVAALMKTAGPERLSCMPVWGVSLPGTCVGAALGVLTVLLSSRAPAKRAARVSPMEAVRTAGRTPSGRKMANLISYEENQFSWAEESLAEGSVKDVSENPGQVLYVAPPEEMGAGGAAETGTEEGGGAAAETNGGEKAGKASAPQISVGDRLTLAIGGREQTVTVAGILSESPLARQEGTATLLVSERTFLELTGEEGYNILDIQFENGADRENVEAVKAYFTEGVTFEDSFDRMQAQKRLYRAMAILAWGFLAVIVGITVLHVANTIRMNAESGKRQYGILRAMGLDSGQLFGMLAAQALSYAAGEWPTLEPLLPDFAGKNVLDLGCGLGWHAVFAMEHGAAHVTGTDISEKMLEKARQINGREGIEYRREAFEDTEFPENSFDVVICSLMLHYLASYDEFLEKIHRWLKPDGVLAYTVEHPIFTAEGSQDWYYGQNGEILHFPVDHYFQEGKREAVFLGEKVVKYHRTLAAYLETLMKKGFQLLHVAEPAPTEEMVREIPGMADELRRPMMLIVTARKV